MIPQKTLLALSRSPSVIKLFRQLDVLVLPVKAMSDEVTNNIRTILSKTLVDANSDCSEEYVQALQHIHHLRVRDFIFTWPGRDRLPEGSPLRSFYLDLSLRSSSNRSYGLNKFLLSCESKGVKVIYEGQPEDYGVDSIISPEFSRRQREYKESRKSVSPKA